MHRRSFLGMMAAAIFTPIPTQLPGPDPFVSVLNDPIELVAKPLDCFVPELWARDSFAILKENMAVANLIHRDFPDEIGTKTDVVRVRCLR